jgi:hypothetical protein
VWRSGGVVPPFLASALDRGEWSAWGSSRFTPGETAPGKGDGWTPALVWMLWSREISLASAGNRTPAVHPVAIPTEIRRLFKKAEITRNVHRTTSTCFVWTFLDTGFQAAVPKPMSSPNVSQRFEFISVSVHSTVIHSVMRHYCNVQGPDATLSSCRGISHVRSGNRSVAWVAHTPWPPITWLSLSYLSAKRWRVTAPLFGP